MCGDVGRSKEAEAGAGGRAVLAPASDSRLLCHLRPCRQPVVFGF